MGSFYGLGRAAYGDDAGLVMEQRPDWDEHHLVDWEPAPVPGELSPGPALVRRLTPGEGSTWEGDEARRDELLELTRSVIEHLEASEAVHREVSAGEEGYDDLDAASAAEMRALGYLDDE